MGNTWPKDRRRFEYVPVVTVLQGDGTVQTFPRALRVADLCNAHTNHFVCHASSIVLLNKRKMLPQSFLLTPGDVYFLLPLLKSKPDDQAARDAKIDSSLTSGQQPQEGGKSSSTMKFLITQKQLAKILDKGSSKGLRRAPDLASSLPELKEPIRSTPVKLLHRPSPTLVTSPVTWSPTLASISEVPVL